MWLQMILLCSFLWLRSISVCVCVCVCVYHIFFIHSSVGGRVGCFHASAIVNSAAMNTGVHISFWTVALFGCMFRSEIAVSYRNSKNKHLLQYWLQLKKPVNNLRVHQEYDWYDQYFYPYSVFDPDVWVFYTKQFSSPLWIAAGYPTNQFTFDPKLVIH